jgi:hypothetical protein
MMTVISEKEQLLGSTIGMISDLAIYDTSQNKLLSIKFS